MIAAPEGANDTHLQALAALSRLLIDPEFVGKLKEAETQKQYKHFSKRRKIKRSGRKSRTRTNNAAPESNRKYIIAVTACPTGIAHTYMAEDALKKKAKEMGVDIKVETNGSEGIKNRLTAEDIARADGVIVATDKK